MLVMFDASFVYICTRTQNGLPCDIDKWSMLLNLHWAARYFHPFTQAWKLLPVYFLFLLSIFLEFFNHKNIKLTGNVPVCIQKQVAYKNILICVTKITLLHFHPNIVTSMFEIPSCRLSPFDECLYWLSPISNSRSLLAGSSSISFDNMDALFVRCLKLYPVCESAIFLSSCCTWKIVKKLKILAPEKFDVIILKVEQFGFVTE